MHGRPTTSDTSSRAGWRGGQRSHATPARPGFTGRPGGANQVSASPSGRAGSPARLYVDPAGLVDDRRGLGIGQDRLGLAGRGRRRHEHRHVTVEPDPELRGDDVGAAIQVEAHDGTPGHVQARELPRDDRLRARELAVRGGGAGRDDGDGIGRARRPLHRHPGHTRGAVTVTAPAHKLRRPH